MLDQREIRDPIHGFIRRSEKEAAIIDTPVFQRLRGIRQLALANLVYPGALHTRFDHSLGVMYIAGKLAEQLVDPEKQTMVRLAALLHDLGHGPFSHVSENLLERHFDRSKVKVKEKIHEHLTCEIILRDRELGRKLSEPERESIVGLLKGEKDSSLVRGIISGPLDADKQDYLLRDSYFCGVRYGVFDMDRLIGTLASHQDGKDTYLVASENGLYTIEQFVIAKYHMTTQVYRHRIRLITDAMITRALELGIEVDNKPELQHLYRYDGTGKFIQNYLKWDDQRLISFLLRSKGKRGHSSRLFSRLAERDLFKRVFSKRILEIEPADLREQVAMLGRDRAKRKELEAEIAPLISREAEAALNPHDVILHVFSIKSVREQSRNDEGSILVLKGTRTRKFEDESTLFRSIDESQNDQFVDVYAPLPIRDPDKRSDAQDRIAEGIVDILKRKLNDTSMKRTKREE
jgi:HD superfamily phosphohydrolase